MKRLLALVGLLMLYAFPVIPTPAHASSFKRCGTAGTFYSGAVTLANVQAQRISCKKARSFAREFTRKSGAESGYYLLGGLLLPVARLVLPQRRPRRGRQAPLRNRPYRQQAPDGRQVGRPGQLAPSAD
jgi:hypothetical protein